MGGYYSVGLFTRILASTVAPTKQQPCRKVCLRGARPGFFAVSFLNYYTLTPGNGACGTMGEAMKRRFAAKLGGRATKNDAENSLWSRIVAICRRTMACAIPIFRRLRAALRGQRWLIAPCPVPLPRAACPLYHLLHLFRGRSRIGARLRPGAAARCRSPMVLLLSSGVARSGQQRSAADGKGSRAMPCLCGTNQTCFSRPGCPSYIMVSSGHARGVFLPTGHRAAFGHGAWEKTAGKLQVGIFAWKIRAMPRPSQK